RLSTDALSCADGVVTKRSPYHLPSCEGNGPNGLGLAPHTVRLLLLLLLDGGGGGRIREKSAQHTHRVAERFTVRGIQPLQIRVDGRTTVDTHLPQGVDAFRGDADQHRPRIIGVDGARYQARVFEPADLGGHRRLRAVVEGGQVGYSGRA